MTVTEPPDKPANPTISYSDRVKSNIKYDQRLKRNVLEITLEKVDENSDSKIELDDVARICQTLGIDIETQVEGFNIHFKGKISMLCVWIKAGLNLDKYCRDVSLKIGHD